MTLSKISTVLEIDDIYLGRMRISEDAAAFIVGKGRKYTLAVYLGWSDGPDMRTTLHIYEEDPLTPMRSNRFNVEWIKTAYDNKLAKKWLQEYGGEMILCSDSTAYSAASPLLTLE